MIKKGHDYRENLLKVLQYDSCERKMLSDFDRMFIQKDISDYLNDRQSQLPEYTKDKVMEIIKIIEKTKWECPL